MRLAATVMLVRERERGLEVLMLRRSARSAFAPHAFVFPGGTVDDGDYTEAELSWPAERLAREFRARVPAALPTPEPAIAARDGLALVRAAARELREEAAVGVDPGDLSLFSHWITPPTEPRRYNTHFFVARAPADARGVADAVETHDARWLSPRDALAQYEAGTMHLVYPTIKHLERIDAFDGVEALIAFARAKPIWTVMPDRAPSEGFVMPKTLENAW